MTTIQRIIKEIDSLTDEEKNKIRGILGEKSRELANREYCLENYTKYAQLEKEQKDDEPGYGAFRHDHFKYYDDDRGENIVCDFYIQLGTSCGDAIYGKIFDEDGELLEIHYEPARYKSPYFDYYDDLLKIYKYDGNADLYTGIHEREGLEKVQEALILKHNTQDRAANMHLSDEQWEKHKPEQPDYWPWVAGFEDKPKNEKISDYQILYESPKCIESKKEVEKGFLSARF